MPRDIDALTSFTLKHLRDRWWDASFTAFLQEALLPQAGERVLDVGCGAGTAELILSSLQPGGVHFVGVDLVRSRLRDARRAMHEQAVAAELAAADAARLPFAPASFDAAFAVAVLQHVAKSRAVIDDLRRVLRPGGRLVLAEPDNAARYWFSDPASGHEVFALATEFYSLVEESAREDADPSIGPRVPRLLRSAGFEIAAVHLVPVSLTRAGAPVPRVWDERRAAIAAAVQAAQGTLAEDSGRALTKAFDRYAKEADDAGPGFLEIQNTMLVVTIAQRGPDSPVPPATPRRGARRAGSPAAPAGRKPVPRG
ncbi:MAG: methyltransferase domain-containing protein [Vicinamibacteraceae bacterium]